MGSFGRNCWTSTTSYRRTLGGLVSGILGFAWSMATYFVVPTLAAEEIGPIEALKRSAKTIKSKWGESIGAGFSLGLFNLAGIVLALISGFLFGFFIHPGIGAAVGIFNFLCYDDCQ